MPELRLLHLSDLHIGDEWFVTSGKDIHGLEGHNIEVISALSATIQKLNFDAVVVSGDLTRNGSSASLDNAHQFLFGSIFSRTGGAFGLNLSGRSVPTVVIPGNHDWYNGTLGQTSRSNYDNWPNFQGNREVLEGRSPLIGGNAPLWVRTYDTCYAKGGLAKGYLQEAETNAPGPRRTASGVFVAVLHHHIIQHPSHDRYRLSELENPKRALAYLLANQFDLLMFGHTHDCFFAKLPRQKLASLLQPKARRGKRRFRKYLQIYDLLASFWTNGTAEDDLGVNAIQYTRLKDRNGRLISMIDTIDYYYLKRVVERTDILDSRTFESPRHFHDHLVSLVGEENQLPSAEDALDNQWVWASMAATPTQTNSANHAFTILNIEIDPKTSRAANIRSEIWKYKDKRFSHNPSTEFLRCRPH